MARMSPLVEVGDKFDGKCVTKVVFNWDTEMWSSPNHLSLLGRTSEALISLVV